MALYIDKITANRTINRTALPTKSTQEVQPHSQRQNPNTRSHQLHHNHHHVSPNPPNQQPVLVQSRQLLQPRIQHSPSSSPQRRQRLRQKAVGRHPCRRRGHRRRCHSLGFALALLSLGSLVEEAEEAAQWMVWALMCSME